MQQAREAATTGQAAARGAVIPALKLAFDKYIRDGALAAALLLFYAYAPFYANFLQPLAKTILRDLFAGWFILALPYYTWLFWAAPPWFREEESKTVLLYRWLGRMALARTTAHSEAERVALLGTLVKAYYFPMMVKFFVDHVGNITHISRTTPWATLGIGDIAMVALSGLGLNVLFFIDTVTFAVAYAVEFPLLNNKIRSVEPTFFGWFVALICYPPFVDYSGKIIWGFGPTIGETVRFGPAAMVPIRIAIFCLYAIYVSSTLALFMRSGNLVNRGIVSRGPYAIVRHPAYAAKNAAWWLETLPQMTSIAQAVPLLVWNLVYFLRSVTEENHLLRDPDYQAYVRKVRYRLIPGVF